MANVKIIGKVAVKVMPDTEDFKPALKRDLERIEKSLKALEVDVIPNISASSKQKLRTELNALQKSLDGKNIRMDTSLNEGSMAYVESALKVLSRDRKVEIKADFDSDSFGKALDSILMLGGARPQLEAIAAAFDRLKNLDQLALSTGLLATKFTAVSTAAVALTGNLLSLSGSLASVSQAGLALPGILGGMVVGIGISSAAFKDFNKVIPELGDNLSKLQDTLSENFWAEAEKPIRNMIDTLFPEIEKAVNGTATVLGSFFANLAASAESGFAGKLQPMFDNLNDSIEIFGQHTDSIIGIITTLGTHGSEQLGSLATWFGNVLDNFNAFLSAASANGSLDAWITEGIAALVDLGVVIRETYEIFSGLTAAATAAGGLTLDSLASGLERISNTINSPGFQSGLTEFFAASYDAMERFNDALGPGLEKGLLAFKDSFINITPDFMASLGGLFGAYSEALAQPQVGEGLISLFDGIGNALDTLAAAAGPSVRIFASLGPVLGAMLENIALIMTDGVERLAPTFEKVSAAIVPVINKLGALIHSVFEAMTPVFEVVGENVARLVTAFGPLIDTIQRLWDKISPILIPVLKVVASILGEMLVQVVNGVRWVFEGLIKIIDGVIKVFKGAWDAIAGLFTMDFGRVLDGFKGIFGGLWQIILGALQGALGALWAWLNGSIFAPIRAAFVKLTAPLAKAFNALKASAPFQWLIGGVADGIKATGTFAQRLRDVLTYPFIRAWEVIRPVVGAIGGLLSGAFTVARTVIGAALKVIVTLVKAQFKIIGKVIEVAFKVISTVAGVAFRVIRTLIEPLLPVFRTVFNGAKSVVSTAFKVVQDVIGAAFKFIQPLVNAFKGTFDLLWAGIKLGIENARIGFQIFMDSLGIVGKFVDDALQPILDLFSVVWAGIRSAVDSVIVFLMVRVPEWINAIKGFINAGLNFIKGIWSGGWNAIKTTVSNIWTGIKNFVKNYLGQIRGDINAIMSAIRERMAAIWGAIRNTVSTVWGAIKNAIGTPIGAARDAVVTAVTRIKTFMSDTWTTIKTTLTTAWNTVKTTITTKVGDAADEVGKLPGKAVSALAGIASTLINAGRDLIQGFINGIKEKFGDVRSTLSDLTGKLTDWKGPESLDRVLLTPVGQLIIDGFIKGLESRYKDVRGSLQGLTNDLAKQFDSGHTYRADIATDLQMSSQATGLVDRLTSTVGAAGLADSAQDSGAVHIDNITIPLEDLAQLRTLEEFLDMLRVRSRQGVLAA